MVGERMDREKVIKGVHDARRYLEDREWVDKSVGVHIDALNDALALLKEPNAVEPKVSSTEQRCGNCNKVIEMDGWIACPWCGKRIDWEGWWKKNGTRNQDT